MDSSALPGWLAHGLRNLSFAATSDKAALALEHLWKGSGAGRAGRGPEKTLAQELEPNLKGTGTGFHLKRVVLKL